MSRILIFANGDLPDLAAARALVHVEDLLIAADGGALHILELGYVPHIVVGDLDSSPLAVNDPRLKDTEFILFPRDKNETDLELAIDHALTIDAGPIVIVGALGHRLDQTLGNIALLTQATLSTRDIRLDDGVEEAFFCRDRVEIQGKDGDLVSLLPWRAEVTGIVTRGLRWPLQVETLYPDKTRGISNEMLANTADVEIKTGLLLVVHRRQPLITH